MRVTRTVTYVQDQTAVGFESTRISEQVCEYRFIIIAGPKRSRKRSHVLTYQAYSFHFPPLEKSLNALLAGIVA